MRHYLPDKGALTTLRIVFLITAILLVTTVKLLISADIAVFIVTGVIAFCALILSFVYLPLYFASIRYIVTGSEVIRKSGVFIKTHCSILHSSIQYTTVIDTPFSEHTGMNFIVFFVYGGRLRLSFLRRSDVQEILALTGSVSREEV